MEEKRTPLLYRAIRVLVRLFSPKYQAAGAENLPEGACIIVGNHCHMYGPIAGELYIPGSHYIWCAGEMLHWKEVHGYAYRDFWSGKPRGVRWFYRLLSYLITPLSVLIFNNAHTIPVYQDTRLLTTFRETMTCLMADCRVVIFPESYRRYNNIIYDFQDKFVDVARFYYRKTKRELSFVPMYLAPELKKMVYGTPVVFRADAPLEEERRRICAALKEEITRLAAALPEHTVIPYPNMPKRRYPKNIPVEVYPHENEEEAL